MLTCSCEMYQDVSWLDGPGLRHIPRTIYDATDYPFGPMSTAFHRPYVNRGNEAGAYLQFIIDYYDHLPNTTVFLHAHRHGLHPYHAPVVSLTLSVAAADTWCRVQNQRDVHFCPETLFRTFFVAAAVSVALSLLLCCFCCPSLTRTILSSAILKYQKLAHQ
jgi:hypothetical protein